MIRLLQTLIFALATAAPVAAVDGLAPKPGESRRTDNPAVRIDEKVGDAVPLDAVFRGEDGTPVALQDCVMPGKPAILVLAYYRCPMLCTKVLNGLVDAMKEMPLTAGTDFTVITISFDPKEPPALAAEKKKAYLAEYGRPGAEAGWRFLVGDKTAIDRITKAVGFGFAYDKAYKEYDHPSGLILLTPEGKISRYFYGINYADTYTVASDSPTPQSTTLRLSLVEASEGKVGSLMDKLLLRCYRFDHLEQKYALNILMAVRVGGILTVVLLAGSVTYFIRRERRKLATEVASRTAERTVEGTT